MEPLEDRQIQERIYLCDDPGSVPLFSRRDLPPSTWEAIRQLQELDTSKNWKILFFYVLWGAAAYVFLQNYGLATQAFCVVTMGLCINGLPILMHDACHTLLSKNARVNRWLGYISGAPGLVAVSAYRSIHALHHAHTRTEQDPDSIEDNRPRSFPLVLVYYLVLVFGIYLYIGTVASTGYSKANRSLRRDILTEYLLLIGTIVALFIAFPASLVFELWFLPLLVAAQLSNVRGLAEHGLTTGGNPFTNTRTVISNPFVSYFMSNLNYHLEHHLFPGVPCYNLPKLHGVLREVYPRAGSSVYRSYTEFLLDFFRVSRKGLVPNFRLIPAHIREQICG